jgi:hypothetical protein
MVFTQTTSPTTCHIPAIELAMFIKSSTENAEQTLSISFDILWIKGIILSHYQKYLLALLLILSEFSKLSGR